MSKKNHIQSSLLGLAVGDALGVPVEFTSRQHLKQNPVTGMMGYGSHNVPPGTFSDDSSLAFCLAEALTGEFSLHTIANNFINWRYNNYWTAFGTVFDIGITTAHAINKLKAGTQPELAGGFYEDENGNGSLMRILPLVFYIRDKPVKERFILTRLVSSLTHGHIRSVISCFYYLEFAGLLMDGIDKFEAYNRLKTAVALNLTSFAVNPAEIKLFSRLLGANIYTLPEDSIKSSGYVLHTLEASIWCLLTTDDYAGAVLKAVNLGSDTDTTGAVTGGLAGLLYGYENIPAEWLNSLARRKDIEYLAARLDKAL
jgi:ADP-ribosylglycohydrolase